MLAIALLSACLLLAGAATSSQGRPSSRHKARPALAVRLLNSSQLTIVRRGRVVIRVRARGKALVCVYVVARVRRAGRTPIVV